MNWSKVRRRVWERDNGICGICHEPVAFSRLMHIDHILPRAHGGTDDLANLRPTHQFCNITRRDSQGRRYGEPQENDGQLRVFCSVRLSVSDKKLIEQAASASGYSMSRWVVEACSSRLAENHRITP